MKPGFRRALTAVFFAGVCAPGARAAQDSSGVQSFDLPKAVHLAVANNAALLSLKEDTTIAEQRVRASLYLFFPKIDLNASATRFNALRSVVLGPEFNSVILSPSDEEEHLYTGRASLRQPLYTGGKSRYAYKLATVQLDQARSQYAQAVDDMAFRAKRAYFDLMLAQESREDAAALLASLEPLKAKVRSASLIERIRFESGYADVRRMADATVKEWESEKLNFLDTLNAEHDVPFAIEGKLDTLARQVSSDVSLAKALAWSQEYRPEFRTEQIQARMDTLAVEMALLERYPTVNLGVLYEFAGPEFPLKDTSWAGTVDLNLPFSFSSWSKIRMRRSEQRQGYLKRVQLQDQIRLEVREAYQELTHWRQEKVKREEEWKEMSQLAQAFLARGGSASEVLEARRRWLEAKSEYREALHSLLISRASLERVTGKKQDEE